MANYPEIVIKNPNYHPVHYWLGVNFGKANKCENPDCKSVNKKRFEYALIKGKVYEKNRDNFIMLCVPCHRKYDTTDETRKKLKQRVMNRYSFPVLQYDLSDNLISEYKSIIEASEKTGIGFKAISNNLRNRSKKSGGFKWKYKQENKNLCNS